MKERDETLDQRPGPDDRECQLPDRGSPRTTPLLLVAAGLATGIVVDRYVVPKPWWALIGALIALACHALLLRSARRSHANGRAATVMRKRGGRRLALMGLMTNACLWLSVVGLAAAWHHVHWYWLPQDSIRTLLTLHGERLVQLEGRVDSPVMTSLSDAPGREKQSRFLMEVQRNKLHHSGGAERWMASSGTVWVFVTGESADLVEGDGVRVVGRLAPFAKPNNPAERDRDQEQRLRGRVGYLQVPHPDCVELIAADRHTSRSARLRRHCSSVLSRYLSGRELATAAAVLLGRRDLLSEGERDRYVRTGTAHLLAISGLHVGVLAAGLMFLCRGGVLPLRFGLLGIAVGLSVYSQVTRSGPPVVRATLLLQGVCAAWFLRRPVPAINLLAFAACWILIQSPVALFNTGTLLSFLAVIALGRTARHGMRSSTNDDALERLVRRSRSWLQRTSRLAIGGVAQFFFAGAAVWCVTLPLAVEAYHVIPLAAVPTNMAVWIPFVGTLASGFGLLFVDWVSPDAAVYLGVLCQLCVTGFLMVLHYADHSPLQPIWWGPLGLPRLLFIYGLIAVAWSLVRRPGWKLACYIGAAIVFLSGSWDAPSRQPGHCVATFLALGHGTCVVLEFPGGETWLYDAGRMGDVRSGVDTVSRFLWSRRIRHLDRIVLSHADRDHYNLVPKLLQRFSVGAVALADVERWKTVAPLLCRAIRRAGVRLEAIGEECTWELGDGTTIDVLSSSLRPIRVNEAMSDNQRSVVLHVELLGRRLLLPGDLEGNGLWHLLSRERLSVDVAMAPHHGSLHSEPRNFVQWCRPRQFVVSGSGADLTARLQHELADLPVRIWHTQSHGAIRCDLSANGCQVTPYLAESTLLVPRVK